MCGPALVSHINGVHGDRIHFDEIGISWMDHHRGDT